MKSRKSSSDWANGDVNIFKLLWEINYEHRLSSVDKLLAKPTIATPLIAFVSTYPVNGIRNLTGLAGELGLKSITHDILRACIRYIGNKHLSFDSKMTIRSFMESKWFVENGWKNEYSSKELSIAMQLLDRLDVAGIPSFSLEHYSRFVHFVFPVMNRNQHYSAIKKLDASNPSWKAAMTNKITTLTERVYYDKYLSVFNGNNSLRCTKRFWWIDTSQLGNRVNPDFFRLELSYMLNRQLLFRQITPFKEWNA